MMDERKQDYEERTPWAHLFPQNSWHDDAHIVGNRKAIELLRDALTAALNVQDGVASSRAFVTDGEGYAINVYVVPFAEMERMKTPYADDDMHGPPRKRQGMYPHDLPRQPGRPSDDWHDGSAGE